MNNYLDSLRLIFESVFWQNLRSASQKTILKIGADYRFAGSSDGSALSLIYSLIFSNNITKVLQLGTWIGFSTVVIADALAQVAEKSGKESCLHTVDPNIDVQLSAREYIVEAGLSRFVEFYDGHSTDPKLTRHLAQSYELIYIDASHNYTETKKEIEIYWPKVKKTGFVVFHDASEFACQFDSKKEGGVGKALNEWVKKKPKDLEYIFLDEPVWANPCGLFLGKKT